MKQSDVDEATSGARPAIAGRLWSPLYQALHPLEAEDWAQTALAQPDAFQDPAARWVLVLHGLARFLRSDYRAAEQAARDARALEQRLRLTAEPLVARLLAISLMFQGRYVEGEAAARTPPSSQHRSAAGSTRSRRSTTSSNVA